MKGYLKDKNVSMMLFIACWVLYTVSVLGRYTFTDAMVKMISEKIFTESQAGFISGAFYIFYAISQIISGRLGDKYSPFALMGLGVLISAFSNLLISFLSSYHDILILWCVNGFFQGMIWAPLIKLLSSVLCKEHRGLALFYISTTFYAGGLCTKAIAIYNFSQGSFRPIFKTSALILFIFFAIWVIVSIISTKKLVYDGKQVQAESKGGGKFKNKDFKKAIISSGFLLMIVPSLVKSMGDVGLKSWGATMIKSTYGLTESFATLMSLIVVLAGFSVPFVTRLIYKVTKSDEVKTSL
ncbi:MAG: MFS transporter, partial [Bacillota bacterium]|nr:MFS transporter [Bacillota bacterium]